MSKLLNVQQLSKRLSIPLRTTYKYAHMGLIPGTIRIGRLWRFREDMIERWILKETETKTAARNCSLKMTTADGNDQ